MKPLLPGSYFVRPFKSYKGHGYTYTHLNNADDAVRIDEAWVPPYDWGNELDFYDPENETGVGKYSLYESIDQMFYHTDYNTMYGLDAETSASRFLPGFDRNWAPSTSTGSYVVNIASVVFGEQVRPGSFEISDGTNVITDSGSTGHLYYNSTPTVIGNIFYPLGIAVIGSGSGAKVNSSGLNLSASDSVTVNFESQVTFYEHTVVCTLEKGEFNYSNNATLGLFASSSVYQSTRSNVKLMDMFASGTLTPYITSIGLYNDSNEMIMVAKVPRAIKRAPEMDQTFLIKLDVF